MANIRPYGPGKFSTILDSYVYDVSLDGGCDEEESNSDADIWYGIMRNGRTIFKDHDPFLEPLNDAERELLTSSAGVILYQDPNGFVYVSYYATDAELNSEWGKVVAEFAEPEQEEGGNGNQLVTCPQCGNQIPYEWNARGMTRCVQCHLLFENPETELEENEDSERTSCDQCEALTINGVFCHETGCPNTNARYDSESGEWIKQRKCFDCGCTVDADDPCCNGESEEN